MVATAVAMLRGRRTPTDRPVPRELPVARVLLDGVVVGLVTGLVGAGGGFLVVPALALLGGLPMPVAVGTSLVVIAMKSLLGFVGDIQAGTVIEWPFLLVFTASSVSGIFVGSYLTKYVDGYKLKKGFGWFVLVMGIYMVLRETTFAG